MAGVAGKRLIITGGFGALGSAVGAAAAAAGAKVALIDRAPASAFKGGWSPSATLGEVDLATPAGAQAGIEAAVAALGGLDALINIAGGFRWETVADGSAETWDALYALNVKTALNASKAALASLKASSAGRIVNIGANGAVKAAAGMGAYAASKAGVMKLTEALAEELKQDGVTVNALLPSIIDTPANRADMPKADFSAWVAPADLAATILFLVSDEARAITGALIPVVGRV